MEARMTVCNMSIEGGARCGYINPDQTTYEYLQGRVHAPKDAVFDEAVAWWNSMRSEADSTFDDEVTLDAASIKPTVTWGINPGQSCAIDEHLPAADGAGTAEAMDFMGFESDQPIAGTKVDVAFIGSCTNSRISDLREAARVAEGRKVTSGVRALVVPGSHEVRDQARSEGLDVIFKAAGFDWREPGCSMCLAMNPDKLQGRELCASSSNRNFKGRQGSPTGRTLLMSPAMVAAAAVTGEVTDVRSILN